MSEVTTSKELNDAVTAGAESVIFPATANLLLNDGLLTSEQIDEIEAVARQCGRLVHRR